MKTWKDDLPGCFGSIDLRFCSHPADTRRALKLTLRLLTEAVTWREVEQAIRNHLQGASDKHVEEQVKLAAKKIKPWL